MVWTVQLCRGTLHCGVDHWTRRGPVNCECGPLDCGVDRWVMMWTGGLWRGPLDYSVKPCNVAWPYWWRCVPWSQCTTVSFNQQQTVPIPTPSDVRSPAAAAAAVADGDDDDVDDASFDTSSNRAGQLRVMRDTTSRQHLHAVRTTDIIPKWPKLPYAYERRRRFLDVWNFEVLRCSEVVDSGLVFVTRSTETRQHYCTEIR